MYCASVGGNRDEACRMDQAIPATDNEGYLLDPGDWNDAVALAR